MEPKFISELRGFSGCKILLYSNKGSFFVRKISKSKDYNKRLENQMNKQDFFKKNLSNELISTPTVFNNGYLDELFYFDMEYIQGEDLISLIEHADINEMFKIVSDLSKIISIMKNTNNNNKTMMMLKSIEKLSQIISQTKNKEALNLLNELKSEALKINEVDLNETFCHGDLTLENILYDKNTNRYYLIDYLDSYVNHYWLDIVKLFQDIEGHWFAFRNKNLDITNMTLKMFFLEKHLKEELLSIERNYSKLHYFFLATIFARILPYVTEDQNQYISSKISNFLKKHKEAI